MVTESAHLQIVLEARDRARAELQKTESELRKLGLTARSAGQQAAGAQAQMSGMPGLLTSWTRNLRSSALSMVGFSSLLGVAGLSVGSLGFALHGLVQRQQETARAASDMHNRLLLAGFSVERTESTINDLRMSLDRTAFSALPGATAEVRNLLAEMGSDARRQVGDMTDQLTRLGVDPKEALAAATLAMEGDFSKLSTAMGQTVKDWQTATGQIQLAVREMKDEPGFLGSIWDALFAGPKTEADEELRKYKETAEEIRKARLRALGVDPDNLVSPVAKPQPTGEPLPQPRPPDNLPDWRDTSQPGQTGSIQEQILAAVNKHRGLIINNSNPSRGIGSQLTGMDAVNQMLQTMTPQAALAWARSWAPDSTVFMAQGGVVRRPTFAMLGEAGPEAVVPLRGRGVGSQTIVIPLSIGDREIKRLVLEILDGEVRLREPSLGMG